MFKFLTKKNKNIIEVEHIEIEQPVPTLPSKEELFDKAVLKVQEEFLHSSIREYLEKEILGEYVFNQTREAIKSPLPFTEAKKQFPKARTYSGLGFPGFTTSLSVDEIYSYFTKQILKEVN